MDTEFQSPWTLNRSRHDSSLHGYGNRVAMATISMDRKFQSQWQQSPFTWKSTDQDSFQTTLRLSAVSYNKYVLQLNNIHLIKWFEWRVATVSYIYTESSDLSTTGFLTLKTGATGTLLSPTKDKSSVIATSERTAAFTHSISSTDWPSQPCSHCIDPQPQQHCSYQILLSQYQFIPTIYSASHYAGLTFHIDERNNNQKCTRNYLLSPSVISFDFIHV